MINLDDIKPRMMEFQLGGETYAIPMLDAMDADPVLDMIQRGEIDRADIIGLFRTVLAKHAPNALESMSVAQLHALLGAWQKTGDAGESSASSD